MQVVDAILIVGREIGGRSAGYTRIHARIALADEGEVESVAGRADAGVIVKGRRDLERHILADSYIGSNLPSQHERVAAGQLIRRAGILIIELAEVGEQVHVADGIFEFLERPFRTDVRVPNHRCGV